MSGQLCSFTSQLVDAMKHNRRRAILAAAVISVVVSCYPVVFFGRSFISANTVPMLYPGIPSLPGHANLSRVGSAGDHHRAGGGVGPRAVHLLAFLARTGHPGEIRGNRAEQGDSAGVGTCLVVFIVNILGISAFYHDSAACLVRDGIIIAAAQEERFTRKNTIPGFRGTPSTTACGKLNRAAATNSISSLFTRSHS